MCLVRREAYLTVFYFANLLVHYVDGLISESVKMRPSSYFSLRTTEISVRISLFYYTPEGELLCLYPRSIRWYGI